jgi:hypothetical protein
MDDRFRIIKEKVDARNQFLAENPQYQWLQDEIDEALKKAGNNQHERNRVIQEKMLETWFKIVEAWK